MTAETLLIEWRDARASFLAVDHADPKTFETRKPLFDRLANAEGALMDHARSLGAAADHTTPKGEREP